jgi:hypothetical protein
MEFMPLTHPDPEVPLAQKLRSGAYLVTRPTTLGRRGAVAIKPFNTSYRIIEKGEFILINGEQVTKFVVKVLGGDRFEVTFHLSDGTTYTPTEVDEWVKRFVGENFLNVNKGETP